MSNSIIRDRDQYGSMSNGEVKKEKEDRTAINPFESIFKGPSYLYVADMILRNGKNIDAYLAGNIAFYRIKVMEDSGLYLVYKENKHTDGWVPFGYYKETEKGVIIYSNEGTRYIGRKYQKDQVLKGERRAFLLSLSERLEMMKGAKN